MQRPFLYQCRVAPGTKSISGPPSPGLPGHVPAEQHYTECEENRRPPYEIVDVLRYIGDAGAAGDDVPAGVHRVIDNSREEATPALGRQLRALGAELRQ